jgi:hypothetical protein
LSSPLSDVLKSFVSYLGTNNQLHYVPFCTRRNTNGSPLYCSLVKFAILVFFQFVDDGGGTDVQHARGIANATGVHGHINDLLLDLRRLTGVALLQQKGPSTPFEARTAPIALLAFRRQTMLDNITPLAIGAVQHLDDHRFPHSR